MSVKYHVPWDEALGVLQSSSPDRENIFISLCMPMAEHYAAGKASKYRYGPYATRIDEDSCLDAALQGLWEVAQKTDLQPDPDNLRNLCSMSVTRRLIDLERQEIGRTIQHSIPSNFSQFSDDDAEKYHLDNQRSRMHEWRREHSNIQVSDETKHMKKRLSQILRGQKYEIMAAAIDLIPQGYTLQDIGDRFGLAENTIHRVINGVRKDLAEAYPEMEPMLAELLVGSTTERHQQRREELRTKRRGSPPSGHSVG